MYNWEETSWQHSLVPDTAAIRQKRVSFIACKRGLKRCPVPYFRVVLIIEVYHRMIKYRANSHTTAVYLACSPVPW